MIIPITNKSKNFYAHLGRVFGSREIEKVTKDRFFDDDDKIWYLYYHKGVPDVFVSIKGNTIKNVWGESMPHLIEVLKSINNKVGESKVPAVFKDEYEQAGYELLDDGKNFIKIKGGYDDED